MRALLALVLFVSLASAHDWCGGYGGAYGYRGGYGYGRGYGYRSWQRPYWHHPYYARFGYQRPYLYYRQLRTFGYVPYVNGRCGMQVYGGFGGYGAYGGYGAFYTYYPAYVTVAPVYSRLGVALTLDDSVFTKRDPDGLPRARTAPVGNRFLGDIP